MQRNCDWIRSIRASLSLNVSGLDQTVGFLPNKVELFRLEAPIALAGEPGTRKGSIRFENWKHIKSQPEIRPAARRGSSENLMKKVFLLIVVTALLGALGFAQT